MEPRGGLTSINNNILFRAAGQGSRAFTPILLVENSIVPAGVHPNFNQLRGNLKAKRSISAYLLPRDTWWVNLKKGCMCATNA